MTGRAAAMSNKLLTEVLASPLPNPVSYGGENVEAATVRLHLIVLANHCNDEWPEKGCWPGYDLLQFETCHSAHSVAMANRVLVGLGVISIQEGDDETGGANRYHLHMGALHELSKLAKPLPLRPSRSKAARAARQRSQLSIQIQGGYSTSPPKVVTPSNHSEQGSYSTSPPKVVTWTDQGSELDVPKVVTPSNQNRKGTETQPSVVVSSKSNEHEQSQGQIPSALPDQEPASVFPDIPPIFAPVDLPSDPAILLVALNHETTLLSRLDDDTPDRADRLSLNVRLRAAFDRGGVEAVKQVLKEYVPLPPISPCQTCGGRMVVRYRHDNNEAFLSCVGCKATRPISKRVILKQPAAYVDPVSGGMSI
jgi:hypothetical protein